MERRATYGKHKDWGQERFPGADENSDELKSIHSFVH